MNGSALRVLLVDDEPLARVRLRTLLADMVDPPAEICGEAATAVQAMELLESTRPHVLLLDIHMPGMDGMQLAHRMVQQIHPAAQGYRPQIVFVTASSDFALQAFDMAAADYLTKPVRAERLQQALHKAMAALAMQQAAWAVPQGDAATAPLTMQPVGQPPVPHAASHSAGAAGAATEALLIQERGLSQRLPLSDILYARAEQKYVILHTRLGREWVWDGSLSQLEEKYPHVFVRIHRSTLVQRQLLRQLKHCVQADGSEGWLLQLEGASNLLPVSRRQLAAVRQAMQNL